MGKICKKWLRTHWSGHTGRLLAQVRKCRRASSSHPASTENRRAKERENERENERVAAHSPACQCRRAATERSARWSPRCSSAGSRRRRARRLWGTSALGPRRCRRSTPPRTAGPWSWRARLWRRIEKLVSLVGFLGLSDRASRCDAIGVGGANARERWRRGESRLATPNGRATANLAIKRVRRDALSTRGHESERSNFSLR